MVKPKIKDESKEKRFKRLAETRTQRILDDLRILGNCANKTNYYYTYSEVDKIFLTINKEIKRVKKLFNESKKKQFKL